MDSQAIFIKLRNMLAEFYRDEASARRVVADAGLDVRYIAFSTHAMNNWHNILNEAINKSKVSTLLDTVSKEYEKNQEWINVCSDYKQFVDQNGHFELYALQEVIQSKYKTAFHGSVQGVVQGDDATVTMNFGSPSKEQQ